MRRNVLLLLPLALAAILPQPLGAACPGTSVCKISACPSGSTMISSNQNIQNFINAAANSAKLCVKPGTYNGNINFNGKRITLVSSGGPGVTVLSGTGTGPVVTFKTFEAGDSVLDGFTITNGKAQFGGGVFIQNASPTIRNCILRGNKATGATNSRGGGIWVIGTIPTTTARPSITCTIFATNQADYGGGGLASYSSADPFLRDDTFDGNTAPYGGAIAAHNDGRLDVGRTYFAANQASVDGGAIHAGTPYGNVLVRNCWFKGNKAGSHGGAMWVPGGLAQVVNDTFDTNQAPTGGAIAAGFGGMVDVSSSLFVNNKTTGGGSAALVNTAPSSNTSVVNHYNGFFGNTGGDYLGTYGDLSPLLLNPQLSSCCPASASPAIGAGIPDFLFNNASNGLRNDMGACGGPVI